MPEIALILYTIRDACKEDLPGTLAGVKQAGYDWVQVSGIGKFDPGEVAKVLSDSGLKACGCHMSIDQLDGEMGYVIEACQKIGMTDVIMPYTKARTRAETAELVAKLDAHAATLQKEGLRLGYHNHAFEFDPFNDGQDGPADMFEMIAACEPLTLEIDLGWVWFAGRDPAGLLEQYGGAGRCPLIHIKDFETNEERKYAPVGEGKAPWGSVCATDAFKNKVHYAIIEQDELYGMDPIENVTLSLNNFKRIVAG